MLAGVVVDRSVWSLDRELTYSVPETLIERVRVGSIVRVPLRGRRVRGWVVSLDPEGEAAEGLQPVAVVSGRGPVFDQPLLEMSRRLARRYVHPLSEFLSLFTPPRLGRRAALGPERPVRPSVEPEAALWRLRPAEDPLPRYLALVQSQLAAGRGAIVAVPEVREGSRVLEALAARFPDEAAVVHSGVDPALRSKALWEVAEGRRSLVLGGRAALFAPPFDAGAIVLHQEHDPSYKAQQAPYYDARVVARERGRAAGARVIFASTTPSVSEPYWSGGGLVVEEEERLSERAAWPAVEVVQPPRRGLPQRAIACILAARARGERSIVLLPRVHATESGPGPDEVVGMLAKVVPGASVVRADRPGLAREHESLQTALTADVVVTTEAGLADVPRPAVSVAVALGVDAYLARPVGRAAEEAASALWALASLVAGRHPKGRVVLEVRHDGNHVVESVVRGDYRYFVSRELQARREALAPPFTSLVRLQLSDPAPGLVAELQRLPGTRVLGPMEGGSLGFEILLKTEDLDRILDPLRSLAARTAHRVLVETDPRDW